MTYALSRPKTIKPGVWACGVPGCRKQHQKEKWALDCRRKHQTRGSSRWGEITLRIVTGESYQSVGQAYGVSSTRINQIFYMAIRRSFGYWLARLPLDGRPDLPLDVRSVRHAAAFWSELVRARYPEARPK